MNQTPSGSAISTIRYVALHLFTTLVEYALIAACAANLRSEGRAYFTVAYTSFT
jgi:hypothetical protein